MMTKQSPNPDKTTTPMGNILLLDGDHQSREATAATLHQRGWTVHQAGTLQELQPFIGQVQIMVIDVSRLEDDGLSAIEQAHQQAPRTGMIVLTPETAAKIDYLKAGADHGLLKPVPQNELMAIVDALARRVPRGWSLSLGERRLSSPKGASLQLSGKEFTLIFFLSQHIGEPVSRRRIVVEAYGLEWLTFDQRRLDTLVSRLRKRCRELMGEELPLKTEHREGYSFAAPISAA